MIIGVINQKGGVGKTTTTCNLASILTELGKKVLVIDSDPQANLTQSVGIKKPDKTVYNLLMEDIEPLIIQSDYFDIIPSSLDLADAELNLINEIGRESILKDKIKPIVKKYDYVIIDCGPSLSLLTLNVLAATDNLLIPLEPSMFSLNGLAQLTRVINTVKKKLNPKLNVKGILLTRVDNRSTIVGDVIVELNALFGENKVMNTIIHQNIALAKAQIEDVPINFYDKSSNGYKDYKKLAEEVLTWA